METKPTTIHLMSRMEVNEDVKPYSPNPKLGAVTGYLLPDGRIVRPVVSFQLEDPVTGQFSEPSSDELEAMGLLDPGELDEREVRFDLD